MPTRKVNQRRVDKRIKRHFDGGMKKVNTDISSWNAVYKMINTDGAILKTISHESLSGFIFLLTIPDSSKVEFYEIPIGGPFKFSQPVRNLVFKIVLVEDEITNTGFLKNSLPIEHS